MITLETIMFKRKFTYQGSLEEGIIIFFGKNQKAELDSEQFKGLLYNFGGKRVAVGASHTNPPEGSLGEWLKINVTKVAIASYVVPVLIHEGYAQKVDNYRIKFS